MSNNSLKLIVMNNISDFGERVNNSLKKLMDTEENFIVPINEVRFSNGEGKVVINESIRSKDIFILSDVANHNCTYKMYDKTCYMGPDEHFQDIIRVISAIKGHANSVSVIMPLLYSSRQHRTRSRESLDCAIALQQLESLGVNEIITFDAHDPNIQNAIPRLPFENFYATKDILINMINNGHIDINNPKDLLIISPDIGAMDRAMFYADILKTDVGIYYKRRDLSIIIEGKNPIISHEYLGKDIKDKTVIIVDDMIASGGSVLECAENAKMKGAKKVYITTTFTLFTNGVKEFNDLHSRGIIDGIYTTNLTYIDDDIKKMPWFYQSDCAESLATIINTINKGNSISPLLDSKSFTVKALKKIKKY